MARCPDCNKFTSKNTEEEPEVTDGPDVDEDGNVTMTVKIVNQCAECSTELEESEFELEGSVDADGHMGDGHELEVAEDPTVERTDSSGARYEKRMFGVKVTAQVNCSCGAHVGDVEMKDEVASSAMESLI